MRCTLVCMVGVIYVYVDMVFGFYVLFLFVCLFVVVFLVFFSELLSWMFSVIIWAPAVLSVLYACVLYFCICPCTAQLSMFHMEWRSRNTLIITSE